MTTSGKVLVVGPSWVGDMVMAQSLYKLLRQRDAAADIDVIAPRWSLPLLERMPEVNRGIELAAGHGELALGERRRLGHALRGVYDRAIVLPRSLKSALVPWFARIKKRTGFRGESRFGLINDMRPFDAALLDQTVRRFAWLGLNPDEQLPRELPRPELTIANDPVTVLASGYRLETSRPVVALMPGAEYGPAKQWPPERFAALAQRLADLGVDVWILGSAKEVPLGDAIARHAGSSQVTSLCGKTELAEAVDLLALAEVAVTNDSGLMHVAAAVGTHTIAIYGSSTPDFTPPLTDQASVHYLRLSCSPCFRRECPLGHLNCLHEIAVDDVLASVERALETRGLRSKAGS